MFTLYNNVDFKLYVVVDPRRLHFMIQFTLYQKQRFVIWYERIGAIGLCETPLWFIEICVILF